MIQFLNNIIIKRGDPRLRTDRRAQSAKRGQTGQNGRKMHRGYPSVNMPGSLNGHGRIDRNGLSNTPTDEEYKDDRYIGRDICISILQHNYKANKGNQDYCKNLHLGGYVILKFRSDNLTEMVEKVVVNPLDGHQNLLTELVLGLCRVLDLLPLPLKDLVESQHDEK